MFYKRDDDRYGIASSIIDTFHYQIDTVDAASPFGRVLRDRGPAQLAGLMMTLSKIVLFAAIISPQVPALAQGLPFATAKVGSASGTAFAVQCPNGTLSCFSSGGSAAAASQPIALTPTTIAAASLYQQAAPVGKATTGGGFVQPNAGNAGLICVDISAGATAGLTTPTGGQICQIAIGSTAPITFPATSGAVYVYGTVKGDIFSGSVS